MIYIYTRFTQFIRVYTQYFGTKRIRKCIYACNNKEFVEMKNLKRIITFILVVAICLYSSNISYAACSFEGANRNVKEISAIDLGATDEKLYDGMSADEFVKKLYDSLSPEAKMIYDSADDYENSSLNGDCSMLDVAITAKYNKLVKDLALLSLPPVVFESLKVAAASLCGAAADGPLPYMDIIAAFAAVELAVVCAVSWNEVAPKWNQILTIFKNAFSVSSKNMTSAFSTTRNQVVQQIQKSPAITVKGKRVIINTVTYDCNVKADKLTKAQKQGGNYFVAVLYGNSVWVSTKAITNSFAKVIMYGNNQQVGCFASEQKYANIGEGYFFHYHHPNYKKFHCWYI